jgi:AraC-like DNA-binding protein
MNRLTPLRQTPSVSLARFDHPPGRPHRDPRQETAPGYSISFLEQGSYHLDASPRRWDVHPGMALVTGPGATFRVRHAEDRPSDVSLVVGYARRFVEESDRPPLPPLNVLSPTNRLGYLRLRLARATQTDEPLPAESVAAELLGAATRPDATADSHLFREHQLAWYVDRVEAARTTLETCYAEPHSLTSLAAGAGMSPFHFARVFRELVGTPPHRYLLRVRLRQARERLRDGESVTHTCFAVGFNNLSYFIRAFRRAFGTSPSRLNN